MTDSPTSTPSSPPLRASASLGPLVMIVEDDGDIRQALSQVLADEGYPTVHARHGAEGLERLRRGPPPRLILLDLMMPLMDGWQFRIALRGDPELATIPIIVVTADAAAEDRVHAMGVAGFLKKPVSIEDLLAAIRTVVGPGDLRRSTRPLPGPLEA
jgi:CheY-like chemotaxis protein